MTDNDVWGLQAALNERLKPNDARLTSALEVKADANHTHPVATTQANGFMSASDKAKLNDLNPFSGDIAVDHVIGLLALLSNKSDINHTHFGLINSNPVSLLYTASQSSVYNAASVATYTNLTDGNYATGGGTGNDAVAWIAADLGSVRIISQVSIGAGTVPGGWGSASSYVSNATLESSINGSVWTILINTLPTIPTESSLLLAVPPIAARYVRIRRNANYMGFCEFKIFG